MNIVIGQITMNGKPIEGYINVQEMCQTVVDAGLFKGTAEQLWDSQTKAGNDLSLIADLYYFALHKQGNVLEIYNGEKFMPMFRLKEPSTNQHDNEKGDI